MGDPKSSQYSVYECKMPTGSVQCGTCHHSILPADTEPVYGWRLCKLNLEGGGGFAKAYRRCEALEVSDTRVQI